MRCHAFFIAAGWPRYSASASQTWDSEAAAHDVAMTAAELRACRGHPPAD